jgi:hypothetical protein
VPQEPQREMEFVFVEHVREVFDEALLPAIAKPASPSTNGERSAKTSGARKSPVKVKARARKK